MLTTRQLARLRAAAVPSGSSRLGLAMSLMGLSQATVGRAVGLPQRYVSDIARSRYRTITGANPRRFARYCGCLIENLFPADAEWIARPLAPGFRHDGLCRPAACRCAVAAPGRRADGGGRARCAFCQRAALPTHPGSSATRFRPSAVTMATSWSRRVRWLRSPEQALGHLL